MRPQELVRILEADGWYCTGQEGSHRHYRHPVKRGLIIVPMHSGKEMGKGLLHSILKKAVEMTREYLVVYEKGEKNWSAFSPDVPGCGSLGDALEDTRANMREALELYLRETAKAGEPLPEPAASSIDFTEFDPDHQTKHYAVEWLSVSIPQSQSTRATQAA